MSEVATKKPNVAIAFPEAIIRTSKRPTFEEQLKAMAVQPVNAELRIKVLVPGQTDRNGNQLFARIDLDEHEIDTNKPENYRVGFMVEFEEDKVITYVAADRARDAGLLSKMEGGNVAWGASTLGYQPSATEGERGTFTRA